MANPLSVVGSSTPPVESRTALPVAQLNRKMDGFAFRVLSSPFVHALTATACTSGFACITVVSFAVGAPLFIGIPLAIIASTSAIALAILIYKQKDVIWFDLSLLFVKLGCVGSRLLNKGVSKKVHRQRWYNTIPTTHVGANRLHLGAIPLANKRHHQKICRLPGAETPAILTVTEPFENSRTGLMGDPVRPTDWRNLGVNHEQMCVYDMRGLTVAQLDRGVDYIRRNIAEGRSVYVHCKAGRGRSLLMVVAYLMRHERPLVERQPGNNLVEKALNLVKTVRPQIRISGTQRRALHAYANTL